MELQPRAQVASQRVSTGRAHNKAYTERPVAANSSIMQARAASDATLDKRRLRATAGGLTTHAMS